MNGNHQQFAVDKSHCLLALVDIFSGSLEEDKHTLNLRIKDCMFLSHSHTSRAVLGGIMWASAYTS